ncbi:MAG: sugar kinase [Deltaproteobacteria bacterium]|nr:sugar kinase [Deltaproteobacteria bacterium]MBW2136090.1 sugar kinase [Deltaproteobacteria bacterium]
MNWKGGKGKLEDMVVVGLGQACVDYLGRIPRYPIEDAKVELIDLRKECGGPASTALVTLARLGVKASFLGSISDDPFGIDILNALRKEGVDTSFLRVRPGHTSQFAFIAITSDSGNRTVFWHRGTVSHLGPEEIDLSPFPAARILHLDGLMVNASVEAASQAKERGMRVVMDAGTFREGTGDLLPLVDVLIASEHFAEPLTGGPGSSEKDLELLRERGPAEVIITMGVRGSLGLGPGGLHYQKAFPVVPVDTTGAGDVYHGGYIYGLLQGWDMPTCMRFASAIAAMNCRKIGARQGIPRSAEDVLEFTRSHLPL